MKLAEECLSSNPENYNYLYTLGWGHYKKGNYQEASELLQKSWDNRIKYATYDHTALQHLEAARKAGDNEK